jgi:protoporphyrinogen oxidase
VTVAIVGAGVTGLSLAYLLLERGIGVRIYEAAPHSGGLAATYRRDGFAFDLGPHEFVSDNPALKVLLEEVCGDDLITVRKRVAQHFRGRALSYPFEVADVVRSMGAALSARIVAEALLAPLRKDRSSDPNFESWTRAHFGPTLYDIYFGPYTRKVWGVEPTELDIATAKSRISVDSAWALMKKTLAHHFLGQEEFENPHSELRHSFLYVKHGIGRLQEHLEARVRAMGGEIHFGKRLAGLDVDASRVRALRFEDGTRDERFDYCASSAPLPLLAKHALGPADPRAQAAEKLPFRGMVFVFLRARQPKLADYHWIYFPEPRCAFQRTTEFVHFGAEMAPAGSTGVAFEIATNPGEALWNKPDAELVKLCVDEYVRLGWLKPENVLGADVVRIPHAYPIQVRGFRETADGLIDALARFENLVTIGRQGLFRYCNINECLEMSIDVAQALEAGQRSIRYQATTSWIGAFAEGGRDAVKAITPSSAAPTTARR